jgi:hypothetical protein
MSSTSDGGLRTGEWLTILISATTAVCCMCCLCLRPCYQRAWRGNWDPHAQRPAAGGVVPTQLGDIGGGGAGGGGAGGGGAGGGASDRSESPHAYIAYVGDRAPASSSQGSGPVTGHAVDTPVSLASGHPITRSVDSPASGHPFPRSIDSPASGHRSAHVMASVGSGELARSPSRSPRSGGQSSRAGRQPSGAGGQASRAGGQLSGLGRASLTSSGRGTSDREQAAGRASGSRAVDR